MVEFEEKIQEYCEAREQGVIVSPFLEFSLFYLGTNIEHKIWIWFFLNEPKLDGLYSIPMWYQIVILVSRKEFEFK